MKGLQRRFDHLLRCHHTNTQHKMDPRLMRLLYTTGHHWPGRRLEIVSGYRNPSVAKNPKSPHKRGVACDFRIAGRVERQSCATTCGRTYQRRGHGLLSQLRLRAPRRGAQGQSRRSGSTTRAPASAPSIRATPDQDLKNGRAETYHPTKIDTSWADAPAAAARPGRPSSGAVRQPVGRPVKRQKLRD